MATSEEADTVEQIHRFSRRWLRERFPLAQEWSSYSWATLRTDLLAGATVSLVSIPQAIGFALIAGLPPLMVIMSVIVGGFIGALFTSSHHLVFGPTNSISLILAATIYSLHGGDLTPPQIALLLALLIGLFQLIAGLAQLGKVTQFISRSVIIGYSTAIGLLLAANQLPHLLGMQAERGSFLGNLIAALVNLGHLDFNIPAAAMGVLSLLVFEAFDRWVPKIPAELLGLVLMAVISRFLGLHELGIRTIGDEGALAVVLPSFSGMPLESGDWQVVPPLMGAALAVAILGMLEAISIGKTLAAKSGQRLDSNQELVSMGLANIGNSLFGAMPGSASFARSGANINAGAKTQLSALSSSLIVLAALFCVAPWINYIPVPSLAAHLIRIGFTMIHRDQIRIACRATRSDALVFFVTLISAFFLKLDIAIYVGVGLSLALFLRKASAPSLVEYGFDSSGQLTQVEGTESRKNPAISIVHVEGELFFGAADLFQEQVRYMADESDLKVIILRMKNARHLDATSVMSLLQLQDYLKAAGRHLIVSGISPEVEHVLKASGAWKVIGAENIFPAEANLTMSTKRALLRASHLLQIAKGQKADVRIFYDKQRAHLPSPTAAENTQGDDPRDYQI